MCAANAFHISDSHSLFDISAILDGSCKSVHTDIPLTWLLMSKSVVLAYSSSLSTLGWSCEYCFFWFVVTSLWLSSQDCTMVCQPTLNTCFSISYMSYANQASPCFLGCHLAFPGNHFCRFWRNSITAEFEDPITVYGIVFYQWL